MDKIKEGEKERKKAGEVGSGGNRERKWERRWPEVVWRGKRIKEEVRGGWIVKEKGNEKLEEGRERLEGEMKGRGKEGGRKL